MLSPSGTTSASSSWMGLPYKLKRTGLSWLLLPAKHEVKAGLEAFQKDKLSPFLGSCQADSLERGKHYVAEQTALEEGCKQNQADQQTIFTSSPIKMC